jgi:transcription termination factor Rho
MEGPLVSDTTELLSGAPSVSEGAPVDSSTAGGAATSTSKSRSRGGTGLSSLLMPELQRIAQTLGIPGAGRMRKGQLIEAIEARQGGAPRQETGTAKQGSDKRVASAGADSTRLRKQDAMEPDTRTQPGIGEGAAGIGASAPGGIGADGAKAAGQQLSFDQAAVTDRPNGQPQQAATQAPAQQAGPEETAAAPQAGREEGQPAGEAAAGDMQRGDRRRRNGRRDEQSSRGRDQERRDQAGRE